MLTEDSFVRLVAEDVKNKVSEEQRQYLRRNENLERWKNSLEALIRNIDDQISDLHSRQKKESGRLEALGEDGAILLAELQTDIESRLRKVSRFKFHVESRLDEAERLLVLSTDESSTKARAFDFFRSAIEKHKELILSNDYEYSEIDEALWATLGGYWEFDELKLGE